MKLRPEEVDAIIGDRSQGKPAADRTGYVGIARYRGPRGRTYRPMRTAVCLDLDAAIAELDRLTSKPYAHQAYCAETDVVEVDSTGQVRS